jgi:hypothetical protein
LFGGKKGDKKMKKIFGTLVVFAVVFGLATTAGAQASSSYDTSVIAPQQKPVAGYDGMFFVQSGDGDYKLQLGFRVDTMFFWGRNNLIDNATTPLVDESKDELSFRLRRAQVYFIPSWKKFSAFVLIGHGVGFGGAGTYWVATGTYDVNKYFSVSWGMDDPAYDLLSITSSKRLTMVDYPIVMTQKDGEQTVWQGIVTSPTDTTPAGQTISRPSFGLPTQQGIFLSGNAVDGRFSIKAGVGNGSEGTATTNWNRRFLYALRTSFVVIGDNPYGDLTDLSYSQTPSFAIGLGGAFEHDPAKNVTTGVNAYNWSLDGTADMVFKWRGFAANLVGYYRMLKTGPGATVEAGEKHLTDIGYLATLSMFAIPKRLEFQGWGAQIIREGPDNNVYEFGGGVNYYIKGHNAKLMLDYSRAIDYDDFIGTNNRADNRVRLKMQLYF